MGTGTCKKMNIRRNGSGPKVLVSNLPAEPFYSILKIQFLKILYQIAHNTLKELQ